MANSKNELIVNEWTEIANFHLKGKKVKEVKWMSEKDMESAFNWSSRAIQIHFTDGTFIEAWRDDEGNDAGALFYAKKGDTEGTVFPVI